MQLSTDEKNSTRYSDLQGKIVSSSKPRRHCYWGYTTRIAESVTDALHQSPYETEYDLIIGTSDKGDQFGEETKFPEFEHALVCFGGLAGLEDILESDESITTKDPRSLFHCYLNICPNQGTRTIRTEEAVLITLARLSPELSP